MDCHISTLPKIWTNLRTQIHAWLPQPRSQLKDSIQSSLDLPKLQQVSNGNKNCTDRQNGGKKCVRPALNNLKLLLHPPCQCHKPFPSKHHLQVHQTLPKEILPGQIKPLHEDMFNSSTFLLPCSPHSVPTD